MAGEQSGSKSLEPKELALSTVRERLLADAGSHEWEISTPEWTLDAARRLKEHRTSQGCPRPRVTGAHVTVPRVGGLIEELEMVP
jgi:hypothetical protein